MKEFKNLTLFGKTYSADLLHKQASESEIPWQDEFWNFILTWLNKEDFIIAQSSGSTGKPKKIKLSKQHMLASAQMTCEYFKLKKGDKALLCMSPKHIGGMMMIVRAFYAELDLHIIEPTSNPLSQVNSNFDFIAIVPYQAKTIIQENPVQLKAIKNVLIGGGAIDQDLEKQLTEEQINAYSSFGMTETISHFALRKIGQEEFYTCLSGVHIEKNDSGCLVVYAPQIHEEAIVTKDFIEILSPTRFVWLGRADFAMETGGIKVLPEEVEKNLSHLISERFFISSIPHSELNNQIILIIEGAERELEEELFDGLSKYHRPKKVYFIPKFIETGSGKIDRGASKEIALK